MAVATLRVRLPLLTRRLSLLSASVAVCPSRQSFLEYISFSPEESAELIATLPKNADGASAQPRANAREAPLTFDAILNEPSPGTGAGGPSHPLSGNVEAVGWTGIADEILGTSKGAKTAAREQLLSLAGPAAADPPPPAAAAAAAGGRESNGGPGGRTEAAPRSLITDPDPYDEEDADG